LPHLHNFNKINSGVTLVGAYDYYSIMHYPFWAFNINSNTSTQTITSKTSTPVPFYNYMLTSGDIDAVNTKYPPNTASLVPTLMLLLDDDP